MGGCRHSPRPVCRFPLALREVRTYLHSLLQGVPQHYAGHNPAGSWAVLFLLALVALSALTGWITLTERGPHWSEDLHEGLANAAVTLVAVHVAAVLLGSWQHRENLVRAMVDGYKAVGAGAAAAGARWFVAVALLAVVVAFWAVDGSRRPALCAAPARRPGQRASAAQSARCRATSGVGVAANATDATRQRDGCASAPRRYCDRPSTRPDLQASAGERA